MPSDKLKSSLPPARLAKPTIPVFKPLLETEEEQAAQAAIKLGWLGMGSYVNEFEQALSQFLALKEQALVCVNTGHSAIHLALKIAGVGPGDEVITPSFNCVSDLQAISTVGAKIVFCDVRDDNLTIDCDSAEALITKKTKAIIAIDYAASLCDHQRLNQLKTRYRLRIIHDACHSFGSRDGDKKVGVLSDITVFSFDPVKTITSLDGGALIVPRSEDKQRLQSLRLLGMTQASETMYQNQRAWGFNVYEEGYRYHLINLHAAVGLTQLKKIDSIGERRRQYCQYYLDKLQSVAGLRLPQIDLTQIIPFLFVVRVAASIRTPLREFLAAQGIETGIHWPAGHSFEYFQPWVNKTTCLTVSDQAQHEILTLPLHSNMSEDSLAHITDSLIAFFNQADHQTKKLAAEAIGDFNSKTTC